MKLLTDIFESKDNEMTLDELKDFYEKCKTIKDYPSINLSIMDMLIQLKILSKQQTDAIIETSGTRIKAYAQKYGTDEGSLKHLSNMLRSVSTTTTILLLPMYMTPEIREDFISGNKSIEDITIDLTTNKGRNQVVKKYTLLLNKIVNQYVGESSLSRTELMSAAMLGLIKAMNDYNKNDAAVDPIDKNIDIEELKKQKRLSFTSYAAWRMRQQILGDIQDYSRNVRLNQQAYAKSKERGETLYTPVRFNQADDDHGINDTMDRIINMSETPSDEIDRPHGKDSQETLKFWQQAFKLIEEKFGLKKAKIFYQTFGVNGYALLKKQDIARQNGISSPFLTHIVKQIIEFCRNNPKLRYFLTELQDAISESILASNHRATREQIYESFVTNELYVYLENLTKFDYKLVYENKIKEVLALYNPNICDFLTECLKKGNKYIFEHMNTCINIYIDFLENMNPSMSIGHDDDMEIVNEMCYLSDRFNEYKITL